jgi:putative ABC transport system permease protein
MPGNLVQRAQKVLESDPAIDAWAPRVKFGAMFSNFTETTSIRVNGVDPVSEAKVTPLLPGRQLDGKKDGALVERGEILVPALVARGLQVKAGDNIVLVATNRDGSVNGKTFVIRGTVESATGPGGRDGYIHIDDARELLRMNQPEVSEIAVRLKDPEQVDKVVARIDAGLADIKNKEDKPALEVHSWQRLSPFASIANMIDIMTISIKVMLVAIVLVAIMNVMVMAVYERIREIGTIAAIGTPPSKILNLFLGEGLMLGIVGTLAGTLISIIAIYGLNVWKISFSFGQQQGLLLTPSIGAGQILFVDLMVIAVAIVASLQPAWTASRMDPITALRHV